jgi:hypothetical protein
MNKRTRKAQKEVLQSTSDVVPALASAAALRPGTFDGFSARSAIPRDWEARARKAVEYYQEEPLVANAINAWRTFALGDEIGIECDDASIRDEAQDLYWTLGLNSFVKDMILQLLVKGDAIGYVMPNEAGDDLERVICVNPVSVRLGFKNDALVEAVQRPQNLDGSYRDEIPLNVDQMLHLKWNAPEFEPRGNSMVLPAFEAIDLLHDYRKAERAIAKRWTTPLRFVQVGGSFGGKLIVPDQAMLDRIRDEMGRMDMRSGMVVPFYVNTKTYGAEGHVLNTEDKIRDVKEDILVALGLSRSVVSGEGPNFATASISMQKMVVQLKEIKQAARDILDWVFNEWLELRGNEDAVLHYQFSDLDLTAEVDQKKLLIDLYDRGLISKATVQQKMGLSPKVEARVSAEEDVVVDRNWSVEDISRLVALEVLTVDEARGRLGIAGAGSDASEASSLADVTRLYAKREEKHDE